MILLLFSCFFRQTVHHFSLNNETKHDLFSIKSNVENLLKDLKNDDIIFFTDFEVNEANSLKFNEILGKIKVKKINFMGSPTLITISNFSNFYIKDMEITINNMTFINCKSNFFKIEDSNFDLTGVNFVGYSTEDSLITLSNCTSKLTEIECNESNGALISAFHSIVTADCVTFRKATSNSSLFYLDGSSFEINYGNFLDSSLHNLITMKNSNNFMSFLYCNHSKVANVFIELTFSNSFIRTIEFNKSKGSLFKLAMDSSIHMSEMFINDHELDFGSLINISDSTFTLFDGYVNESSINSIAYVNNCSPFILTNFTFSGLYSTNTLFQIKLSSVEFTQVQFYRTITQSEIGMIHIVNSEYIKMSSSCISGSTSRSGISVAIACYDVSSAYFDDFSYYRNIFPMLISQQTNIMILNSFIENNNIFQKVSTNHPMMNIQNFDNKINENSDEEVHVQNQVYSSNYIFCILQDSSIHFFETTIFNNTILKGKMLILDNSYIYFKSSNFSNNNGLIEIFQSEARFSKTYFEKNKNTLVCLNNSKVVVYKCDFRQNNGTDFLLNANSRIVMNTTIANDQDFLSSDDSVIVIRLQSCRFDFFFNNTFDINYNKTTLILKDTLFNCQTKCENDEIFNAISNNLAVSNQDTNMSTNKKDNIGKDDNLENKTEESAYEKNYENFNTLNLKPYHLRLKGSDLTEYRIFLTLFPLLFLFIIIYFRFKTPYYWRKTKRVFDKKGRYQL